MGSLLAHYLAAVLLKAAHKISEDPECCVTAKDPITGTLIIAFPATAPVAVVWALLMKRCFVAANKCHSVHHHKKL